MESFGSLEVEVLDGTPPFVVSWSGPTSGSEILGSIGILMIDNLLPGSYSIEVLDANSNMAAVIAEISEFDIPTLTADVPLSNSGFSIACNGFDTGSASVMGIGGAMPYTYQWSNGETSSEIENLIAGMYSVTLTDVNNCIVETVVNITEPPALELILDLVDLTCDDFQSGQITLEAFGGVAPYSYVLNDDDPQDDNTYTGLAEGAYTSEVVDANGCIAEGEFVLDMPTAVQVELGEDISIDIGETIAIQAQLNIPAQDLDSIGWSMNLETDCDDCLNQILTPTETTTYTIHVIDENGCEQIDEITVFVDTEQDIYIPDVFSPNGDGINDGFTLYSSSRFSPIISELYVYDRWGNQMFERFDFPPNEESLGWNGNYREKSQNPGVFVYYAKVEFIDGSTAFYKGNVTLVR
jgi:gliding motility-associated-like protein